MRQVTHALLTRPPLSHFSVRKLLSASFDLHVLGTPPAFILSQDQTLVKSVCIQFSTAWQFCSCLLFFRFDIQCLVLNYSKESFRVVVYCSIIKVLCHSRDSLFILSYSFQLVKNFLKFIFLCFIICLSDSFLILTHLFLFVNMYFYIF